MKLMTEENLDILLKRLESLAWRMGSVLLVALINFVATNMELFDLPPDIQIVIALVLGEITKILNRK